MTLGGAGKSRGQPLPSLPKSRLGCTKNSGASRDSVRQYLPPRFGVLSRMLDNLIEPFVRAASYISYKNDYGRRSANIRFTTSKFRLSSKPGRSSS